MTKPYHAPYWLPGGHLQTILPHLLASRPRLPYQRERVELADGDFIDLDWLDNTPTAPLLVVFHGLEGNAHGYYVLALMHAAQQAGLSGVVVNFRGCSGTPNRLGRAYFAGDSAEIGDILGLLRHRFPQRPLHAAGYSLGGNALLLWLGQQGAQACPIIQSATAVSAPLDLTAAGNTLDRGANRWLYTRHFLRTLKQKVLAKHPRFPDLYDIDNIRHAQCFRDFDDHFTAPVHGFRDAADYWRKASSLPWLKHIQLPTLIINAKNDPFMPASALPEQNAVSPFVTLEFPAQGGHVGFPGPYPGDVRWLPERILRFIHSASQPELVIN